MSARLDVLGLGVVAVDDLLYVERYPPADAKEEVMRRERQCGGLTASALVAASRLGSRCGYAGILGRDELSRFVIERFEAEGIDLSYLAVEDDGAPVHSTIIVDMRQGTRNIFYDIRGRVGAHPSVPDAQVIRASRVLFVDHFGIEGMIRAARIARQAKIPVVADFERANVPRFAELLGLVDHLIVSRDFAAQLTGKPSAPEAALALWQEGREVVVVTCGAEGSWYVTRAQAPVHQAAFRVDALDTTGCGDVFHGAYASLLARGEDVKERVRFASAAAAMKATAAGGQAGVPTREAVAAFLKEHGT